MRAAPKSTATSLLVLLSLASCVDEMVEQPKSAVDACRGKCDDLRSVLDPTRSYEDRQAIVQMLMEAHPQPFADTEEAWPDPMAGILFQTEWQWESGRDQRDESGRLFGFWPNVNYTLTTWQMEALQNRGEFSDVEIVLDSDERFDLPEDIERAIVNYYDLLDETRQDAELGWLDETDFAIVKWELQHALWVFHRDIVLYSVSLNEDVLEVLPPGEKEFSEAWAKTIVEVLAIVNLPTDATFAGNIQPRILPNRIVEERDIGSDSHRESDLPAAVQASMKAMIRIHRFEERSFGLLTGALELAAKVLTQETLADGLIRALSKGEDAVRVLFAFISEES